MSIQPNFVQALSPILISLIGIYPLFVNTLEFSDIHPPCFKELVVTLNISINGTIPSDSYLFLIKQPLGLILDNETPCPPSAL